MLTTLLTVGLTALITVPATGLFTAWAYKKDEPKPRPPMIPVIDGAWYKIPGIKDKVLCQGFTTNKEFVEYQYRLPDGLKINKSEYVISKMAIEEWEEVATIWE